MTTGLHAPPSLLTLVLVAALAIGGAVAVWRFPWAVLVFVPWLYWWAQGIVYINAYPAPALVWFLRAMVLLPVLGLAARRWHRRAPA